MEHHIIKMLSIVNQLHHHNVPLADDIIAAFLLSSVPKKYNIKQITEFRLKNTESVLNFVIEELLEEYDRQDITVNRKFENKFNQTKKALFCTYCKQSNHHVRVCRILKREMKRQAIKEEDMSYQSQSLQPKKLRKPGVTILKEILKKIKLNEDLIRENNEILQSFLFSFIEEMKKNDELFKLLFQKVHYTGSFYHDLRISQPDEFDINLLLNLGLKESDFEVTYSPQVPAFARYRLKNSEAAAKKHPKLLSLFENDYLILEKVRKWIQSVIDKALQSYTFSVRNVYRINPSSSGPARTLKLIKRNGGCIDIDLVPVFSCTLPTRQPGIDGRVERILGSSLATFLVPKPYTPSGQAPVNEKERTRLWRTHFPDVEKELIHDKGCVKPVIKLLKLLRDQNSWKILASYYLKTVVMWMILENLEKEGWREEKLREHWKEDRMDERFIEALKKLAACVEQRNIPYFFSKKNNLLSKMGLGESQNISRRIVGIIRDVEADPTNYWRYFGMQPTFFM